jgi:hypothetical protein
MRVVVVAVVGAALEQRRRRAQAQRVPEIARAAVAPAVRRERGASAESSSSGVCTWSTSSSGAPALALVQRGPERAPQRLVRLQRRRLPRAHGSRSRVRVPKRFARRREVRARLVQRCRNCVRARGRRPRAGGGGAPGRGRANDAQGVATSSTTLEPRAGRAQAGHEQKLGTRQQDRTRAVRGRGVWRRVNARRGGGSRLGTWTSRTSARRRGGTRAAPLRYASQTWAGGSAASVSRRAGRRRARTWRGRWLARGRAQTWWKASARHTGGARGRQAQLRGCQARRRRPLARHVRWVLVCCIGYSGARAVA